MRHSGLVRSLVIGLLSVTGLNAQKLAPGTINRKDVVQRHNFHITDAKEPGPSQVGNGDFAYGFDVTGMQTLSLDFTTMSQWSWHSTRPPVGFSSADFKRTNVETHGRPVPYDIPNQSQAELSQWRAANPHRFNLGKIGLWWKDKQGRVRNLDTVQCPDQYIDLWSGVVVSNFQIEGQPVKVTTIGDPVQDIVAFKIESPLVANDRLGVGIEFPYANLEAFSNGSDYGKPKLHHTEFFQQNGQQGTFRRTLDSVHYQVLVNWTGDQRIEQLDPHHYLFFAQKRNKLEYVFHFTQKQNVSAILSFTQVLSRTKTYWPAFWNSGGFMDLSKSRDPRWMELERRIILSQYVMKINASGNYPPPETGLVNNSWYGRFHYEMILWHCAHYALWDRWPLLNKSLHVYKDNLDSALSLAALQGYYGARFPKCTGPDGKEWPHPIHAFLIWHQPHPIFFAYLDYRAHPSAGTLKKWMPIIQASGDFLASYAFFDSARNQYVLGSPVTFVPEVNDYYKNQNGSFELAYWRFGLRIAQYLRKQAGMGNNPVWQKVYQQLAPLPVKDSVYEQWENIDQMWTKFNFEHPAMLGGYGLLPGDGVDTAILKNTFRRVLSSWKFESLWGWDFPLMAMTAARLGQPDKAVDLLLDAASKNGYDAHGFVGGGNPYPYLPTNGGLLYAVAMMTAGWDGDPNVPQPGFPRDGAWQIRWEKLKKAP